MRKPRGFLPLPTPSTKAARPADSGAQANSAESLGWQLRAALPPLRLQSVSIYNLDGDVLWLSEGALGPDEHSFVVEAIEALRDPSAPLHRERDLQESGGAVFLGVRSPRGELVGIVMILVDAKALQGLGARIVTTQVRAILQSLAILLRPPGLTTVSQRLPTLEGTASAPEPTSAPSITPAPAPARAAADRRAPPLPAAAHKAPPIERRVTAQTDRRTAPNVESRVAKAAPPANAARPTPAGDTLDGKSFLDILEPRKTDDVLTFEFSDNVPVLAPPESAPKADGVLRVQELMKLRAGGRTRRLQVMPRASEGSAQVFDAPALTEIVGWLRGHPEVPERSPMNFAFAVSEQALESERLPALVASCLKQGGVPPESIGFEVQEQACVRHRAQAERLSAQCEKLGCFLVLDDFKFDSAALELLRSKALRLVKVDAKLTVEAMRDKLSQARVIAIAQAAKVLGIHCSAKNVDSQAARRWLTAIGFDFAQGTLAEEARPLESLLALPAAE
jgi:EAL domain-containing protein (putative c-di-GMP-specific phosphodiesterase class I)